MSMTREALAGSSRRVGSRCIQLGDAAGYRSWLRNHQYHICSVPLNNHVSFPMPLTREDSTPDEGSGGRRSGAERSAESISVITHWILNILLCCKVELVLFDHAELLVSLESQNLNIWMLNLHNPLSWGILDFVHEPLRIKQNIWHIMVALDNSYHLEKKLERYSNIYMLSRTSIVFYVLWTNQSDSGTINAILWEL
jgi:hypothetical protein